MFPAIQGFVVRFINDENLLWRISRQMGERATPSRYQLPDRIKSITHDTHVITGNNTVIITVIIIIIQVIN